MSPLSLSSNSSPSPRKPGEGSTVAEWRAYRGQMRQMWERWQEDHPNYCRRCLGVGGRYFPGNYWEPPDFEPCPACYGRGYCPWCGWTLYNAVTEEVADTCARCGWQDGDNPNVYDEADDVEPEDFDLDAPLQPVCLTCGDVGQVVVDVDEIGWDVLGPCPDCQARLV